jgi:hypothetical protein
MFICQQCILYILYIKVSINLCDAQKPKCKGLKAANCNNYNYHYLINGNKCFSQIPTIGGGTKIFEFEYHQLMDIILLSSIKPENKHEAYTFFAYCSLSEANSIMKQNANFIVCRIDIPSITSYLDHC